MAVTSHSTVCRVCESGCGLVADVDGDQLLGLRPDPQDPESRGYACSRGLGFGAVRDAADRPLEVQWRGRRDGDFAPVALAEGLSRVGAKLREIVDAHGPEAVGIYSGNAVIFSWAALAGVAALQRAIGTRGHWTSLSLDNAAQLYVAERVLGDPLRLPVPDLDGADFAVLWGTDPLSSQLTNGCSDPRGTLAVRRLARASALAVVDPRRSATAASAALHVALRPGSDAVVLAWLANALVERLGGTTPAPPVSLATATATADVPEAVLISLRDRLLAAERPVLWPGLGVMLGPDGTTALWLAWCVMAALGPLDRPGGWHWRQGAPDVAAWARRFGAMRPETDPLSGHPCVLGTRPAAYLPEWIRSDRVDRPRALVVVGGDPLRSLPGGARAAEALSKLDLLVCVDIRWSHTAKQAHALFPVATFLERRDWGVAFAATRPLGKARASAPVLPPRGDVPDEWAVLTGLCRAAGWSPFGVPGMGWLSRWAHPCDVAPWIPGRPTQWRPTSVHLDVPELRAAAEVAVARPVALGTRLVTSVRSPRRMNTWLGGSESAYAHPDLLGGADSLSIRGDGGTARVEVVADPSLRPDVVAWSFADGANAVLGARCESVLGVPMSNGQIVHVSSAWRRES